MFNNTDVHKKNIHLELNLRQVPIQYAKNQQITDETYQRRPK